MINMEKTGILLRNAFSDSNKKVSEIAKELNISTTAIYTWLRGENLPSIDNLFLLSEITGKTIEEMVCYETVGQIKNIA